MKTIENIPIVKNRSNFLDYAILVVKELGKTDYFKDYRVFMQLKKKRNDFIHQLKAISKDDAFLCFSISKNILKLLIGDIMD